MILYKLENTIKRYAWGSPDWIPRLMGKSNPSGENWAELWMGTHPEGPSAISIEGQSAPLSQITELPFLLKLLAAGSPLSIQAHPNAEEARQGFERENKAGIPLSAPERNYRDPRHKPEILCALSPFTAMAGFREEAETAVLLEKAAGCAPEAHNLWNKLCSSLTEGYRGFLSAVFGLDNMERKTLTAALLKAAEQYTGNGINTQAFRLCGQFAAAYPDDPGILSPLYLNILELKPFEAIFIPAGILHAYIHGFGVECMASSDNVLRGGLTPKHIDVKELFSILRFNPFKPALLVPGEISPGVFLYPADCSEFSLYRIEGKAELEAPGEALAVMTEGKTAKLEQAGESLPLGRGESAFAGRLKPGEKRSFEPSGLPCTFFAALAPGQ